MFPIGPNPEWWQPDAVILGVKLDDYQHGMDVKVVQSFSGALVADDTVRVWGDCGLLCRHYPSTWNVGDTVVWALRFTDMAGNTLCGTNFEQAGDYMISVCGTYWLEYDNGIVAGQITAELQQSMTLLQFIQAVEGCGAMGLNEVGRVDGLTVAYEGNVPVISMRSLQGEAELNVADAAGRCVRARGWDGEQLPLQGLSSGPYLIRVEQAGRRTVQRVMVP